MHSDSPIFDQDWFERVSMLRFGTTGLMNQNQTLLLKQKEDFLAEKIENPYFRYPGIRAHKFLELMEKHLAFQHEINLDTAHHPVVRSLYYDKISERINEIKLILLIPKLDTSDAQNFQIDYVTNFCDLNKKLYGELSQAVFNGVLSELIERMTRISLRNPELNFLINDFISTYCQKATAAVPYPHKHFNNDNLDRELGHFKDAQAIKSYFENALIDENLAAEWRVVIDKHDKRKTISVGYDSKRILLPNDTHYDFNYKKYALSARDIQKLRVHEISTHARRRHNGSKSNLKLLGLGLAKSRQAEEGIATYREQELVAENNFFAGYLSYFAIGLVNGLDNTGKKLSFRELFTILRKLFLILHKNNNDLATQLAWDRCVRIFRGTPGNIPGLVLTKDAIYRTGNIMIHDLLCQTPTAEKWFDIGRYDPTNASHITALCTLGIIKEF